MVVVVAVTIEPPPFVVVVAAITSDGVNDPFPFPFVIAPCVNLDWARCFLRSASVPAIGRVISNQFAIESLASLTHQKER